jgi:predicted Zn-dependent peptidase
MKIRFYSIRGLFLLLFLNVSAIISVAQIPTFPAPREEQLLNQMRLLVWQENTSQQVTVRLRIHSGAAFDQQGKEGTMQLLADILFPNESIKEFFVEDLNGKLEVVCNYDYIQINATGNADKFLQIMETLATAVSNPQINRENTAKVKPALMVKVAELEKNPAYIADQAIRKRLFGTFPYGRPQLGSSENLAKIDFADILFAQERFLTADNATLAINGNVKSDFALKATKRLFGGWLKSDKKTPSTFAMPEAPQKGLQIVDSTAQNTSEIRFAMRGLARNDKDYYTLQILENILQNRLQMREGKKAFVQENTNFLPGFIVFGVSDWNLGNIKREGNMISLPVGIDTYQDYFLQDAIKPEEFESAKKSLSDYFSTLNIQDYWLDSHTFKFVSIKKDMEFAQNVIQTDVQKLLEKFQKQPVASVLLISKPLENSANTSN